MFEYQLNMAETVGFAIILLLLGNGLKEELISLKNSLFLHQLLEEHYFQ